MFRPSTWVGRNTLKRLMIVLKDHDKDISENIEDYLSVNNHGEYLMNILTSEEIRKLQSLEKDWNLNLAIKNVRMK